MNPTNPTNPNDPETPQHLAITRLQRRGGRVSHLLVISSKEERSFGVLYLGESVTYIRKEILGLANRTTDWNRNRRGYV